MTDEQEYLIEEIDNQTGKKKLILDLDKLKKDLIKENEIFQLRDDSLGISIDLLSKSFDVHQLSGLGLSVFDELLKKRNNKKPSSVS